MRVAWFSPLPPGRSGIAAYSAEVLPLIAARGIAVDTYPPHTAHEFPWRHRRQPYDVTVYQLGNAAVHDYMWAYLFRYPGLVVLHDAQLHQARALALTKRWRPRRDDYLAEFVANHPKVPPALADMVALGEMSGTLFQHWPLTRLVIEASRLTVVHNRRLADQLSIDHPGSRIETISMGVADPGDLGPGSDVARRIRRRHHIPDDALVLGAFGGVTPEKRLPQLLRALSAVSPRTSRWHLLVVGSPAEHYELTEDVVRWQVADRVHVAGFVPDADLAAYVAAADVCACLRWPTNHETSASWLRCLAAGRPTLVTDLADLVDVPTCDPRGWRTLATEWPAPAPVAVSIDLLDEDHSLMIALERLAEDEALRRALGVSARAWWRAHHRLEPMVDDYVRVATLASTLPAPAITLPPHLQDEGMNTVRTLLDQMGVAESSLGLTS